MTVLNKTLLSVLLASATLLAYKTYIALPRTSELQLNELEFNAQEIVFYTRYSRFYTWRLPDESISRDCIFARGQIVDNQSYRPSNDFLLQNILFSFRSSYRYSMYIYVPAVLSAEGGKIDAIYQVKPAEYDFVYELGGEPPSLNIEKTSLNVFGRLSNLSKFYSGVSYSSGCEMRQLSYAKILFELKTKMAPELKLLLPKWVQHPARIVERYDPKTSEIDALFINVLGETARQVLDENISSVLAKTKPIKV